jgi:hypothetical protein
MARFFRHCGNNTPDLVIHAAADALGKCDTPGRKTAAFIAFSGRLLSTFFRDFRPASNAPPLLTGRDLITEFHLAPSPLFKTILEHVEEIRIAGGIGTRQEALAWVASFLRAGAEGSGAGD